MVITSKPDSKSRSPISPKTKVDTRFHPYHLQKSIRTPTPVKEAELRARIKKQEEKVYQDLQQAEVLRMKREEFLKEIEDLKKRKKGLNFVDAFS